MKLGTSIRGRSSASNLSTNVAGSSVAFGWWRSLLGCYPYIAVMIQVINILLKIYKNGFVITVLLFVYDECTVHVLYKLEENKSREVQIQVESFVYCPGGTSGEANKNKETILRSRPIQLTNR